MVCNFNEFVSQCVHFGAGPGVTEKKFENSRGATNKLIFRIFQISRSKMKMTRRNSSKLIIPSRMLANNR